MNPTLGEHVGQWYHSPWLMKANALTLTPSPALPSSPPPATLSSIQTLILPAPSQQNGFWTAGIIIIPHLMAPIPAEPALCPLPSTLPWPRTQFILLLAPTAIFHHPAWPASNPPPQGVFTPHFICLLHAPPAGTGSSSSISGFSPLPSL